MRKREREREREYNFLGGKLPNGNESISGMCIQ
jgi:hypothetical protein